MQKQFNIQTILKDIPTDDGGAVTADNEGRGRGQWTGPRNRQAGHQTLPVDHRVSPWLHEPGHHLPPSPRSRRHFRVCCGFIFILIWVYFFL